MTAIPDWVPDKNGYTFRLHCYEASVIGPAEGGSPDTYTWVVGVDLRSGFKFMGGRNGLTGLAEAKREAFAMLCEVAGLLAFDAPETPEGTIVARAVDGVADAELRTEILRELLNKFRELREGKPATPPVAR